MSIKRNRIKIWRSASDLHQMFQDFSYSFRTHYNGYAIPLNFLRLTRKKYNKVQRPNLFYWTLAPKFLVCGWNQRWDFHWRTARRTSEWIHTIHFGNKPCPPLLPCGHLRYPKGHLRPAGTKTPPPGMKTPAGTFGLKSSVILLVSEIGGNTKLP